MNSKLISLVITTVAAVSFTTSCKHTEKKDSSVKSHSGSASVEGIAHSTILKALQFMKEWPRERIAVTSEKYAALPYHAGTQALVLRDKIENYELYCFTAPDVVLGLSCNVVGEPSNTESQYFLITSKEHIGLGSAILAELEDNSNTKWVDADRVIETSAGNSTARSVVPGAQKVAVLEDDKGIVACGMNNHIRNGATACAFAPKTGETLDLVKVVAEAIKAKYSLSRPK
jgi:hypothetical protein